MKLLVSAFACTPYSGSEDYIGWMAVQCLAKEHDLWVLTSGRHQPDLERAATEGLIPKNLRFVYTKRFKGWPDNRLKARIQSWTEYRDYSQDILVMARELHQAVRFDLVHHVTIATWRISSPLWRLGIPMVWGPVGGNEQFPFRLYPILSWTGRTFELVRTMSNVISRNSRSVRDCARHASHILAANLETKKLLEQLRGRSAGVSVLSPAFYSQSKIDAFTAVASGRDWNAPLRFFAGGMLEGRKGNALTFAALARLKAQGLKFSFHIGGGGPELNNLRQLAGCLNLRENIVFGNWFGADYLQALAASHVFLLPSLRESSGLTMMESMLAGCVPIVADCGGPAHIVTDACGWKIPVGNAAAMIDALTTTIAAAEKDRALLQRKSAEASRRIATGFSEEAYLKTLEGVYRQIIAGPA
jgi:glycosyltransferase involved in cell wall biosynthesis